MCKLLLSVYVTSWNGPHYHLKKQDIKKSKHSPDSSCSKQNKGPTQMTVYKLIWIASSQILTNKQTRAEIESYK